MSKRIQSSLRIAKQSSLSDVASLESTHPQASSEVTGVECEASGECISKHQVIINKPQSHIMHASPEQDSCPKSPPPPEWGAFTTQRSGISEGNNAKSKVTIPPCKLLQEQSSLLPSPDKQCLSQSPQKSSQPSVMRMDEPASVVQKLVRSLSEFDRRVLITQLQSETPVSSSSATEVRKPDTSLPQSDLSKPAGTSVKDTVFSGHQYEHPQLVTVPKSVMNLGQNRAEGTPQTGESTPQTKSVHHLSAPEPGECTPRVASLKEKEKEGMNLSQEEQALDEEQKALALLVERREAEELVAELSRQRMNSLLSEEELAEVSGQHCILL